MAPGSLVGACLHSLSASSLHALAVEHDSVPFSPKEQPPSSAHDVQSGTFLLMLLARSILNASSSLVHRSDILLPLYPSFCCSASCCVRQSASWLAPGLTSTQKTLMSEEHSPVCPIDCCVIERDQATTHKQRTGGRNVTICIGERARWRLFHLVAYNFVVGWLQKLLGVGSFFDGRVKFGT